MTDPMEPVEERLRDALRARADSVEPRNEGAVPMDVPAPARNNLLRNRWLIGLSAAAALLAGVGVAAALSRDGGKDERVISQDHTTTEASTTTLPPTSSSAAPASTVVTTVPATTTGPGEVTTTTAAPPTTTAPPPTTTVPPPLDGASLSDKSGSATGDAAGLGTAVLTDLRTGRQDGYDRVVLQFKGTGTPEWKVRYADGPFTADGSGEPVAVDGKVYLEVRMFRASGYDADAGQVAYHGSKRVPGNGTERVTEVVETGDFEGVMTWIIGLDAKVPFRVQTLTGPARLVIDIAHTS